MRPCPHPLFVMRNIFGQKKSAIDFFDLMNSNKIFIANLSKGEIGEMNCNLAGSLIITQFYLAALKRITLPPETWMLYPLYVNEIHSFAAESFGDILSETRKFGLSHCAANQFLDQLDKVDKSLRSAVLSTPSTLIAFRVGGEDAGTLRKEFAPWPAQELTDLDNFIALIKPLHYGVVREPFKIQTHKIPPHIKVARRPGTKCHFTGQLRHAAGTGQGRDRAMDAGDGTEGEPHHAQTGGRDYCPEARPSPQESRLNHILSMPV